MSHRQAPSARSAADQPPGDVRAELVRAYTLIRRLKLATAVVVSLVVLLALPVVLRAEEVTRDPGFVALDELRLPRWASNSPVDTAQGSRWCVAQCRVRERVWNSGRSVEATLAVYREALRSQDWRRWGSGRCLSVEAPAEYECYRRDEYALDLWLRPAQCADVKQLCPGSVVTAVLRPRSGDDSAMG